MPIPHLQPKTTEAPLLLPPPPPAPLLPPPQLPHSKKRRKILLGALLILGVLIVGSCVAVGVLGARVVRAGQKAVESANAALASAERLDLLNARKSMAQVQESLDTAERSLIFLSPLNGLPYIGPRVHAARVTVTAGQTALHAFDGIFAVVDDILEHTPETSLDPGSLVAPSRDLGSLSREERRVILEKLLQTETILRELQQALQEADAAFSRVPLNDLLPEVRDAVARFQQQLHIATASVSVHAQVSPLLSLIPPVVGYPTPKRYLFLFANNTELRPVGGFLGFYGILTVEDGEIVSFETDDIYNLDLAAGDKITRQPPAPLAQHLGVKAWYLRDANWSPDFPTSAQMALEMYADEVRAIGQEPQQLDGVILMTPSLPIDLLRITGPLTVDEVTFTPENLVSKLEYHVEQAFLKQGIPIAERKQILGHLVEEMIRNLTKLPASRWPEIGTLVQKNLDEKNLLFFFHDPALQSLFDQQKWVGKVWNDPRISSYSNYLMVVDANLAALKTDAVMQRSLRYEIEPDVDGSLIATARMTYTNIGSFTPFTTRYRTYTRFYVPEGSTFLSAEGHLAADKLTNAELLPGTVDVSHELGKTVFGMFTAVEPGETRTLSVRYRLPLGIGSDEYGLGSGRVYGHPLFIQKQVGAPTLPLTLDLRFGKNLTSASPPEERSAWGDDRYQLQTEIKNDQSFDVNF